MVVAKKTEVAVNVLEVQFGRLDYAIIGKTPHIHNKLSEKARHELLFPKGRKNAAEKASSLKHDPVAEFQSSPYKLSDPNAPTLLGAMASSFKGAMMTAALDLPGVSKAQIGRLIRVEGYDWPEGQTLIPFYGGAKLHMTITRSADQARTPDVRTRAISPEWATRISISFAMPLITAKTVVNLLAAGGEMAGVGDWRPQKGSGTFGMFRITQNMEDPDLLRIMKMDRAVQQADLDAATPYDYETTELLTWFEEERAERGK